MIQKLNNSNLFGKNFHKMNCDAAIYSEEIGCAFIFFTTHQQHYMIFIDTRNDMVNLEHAKDKLDIYLMFNNDFTTAFMLIDEEMILEEMSNERFSTNIFEVYIDKCGNEKLKMKISDKEKERIRILQFADKIFKDQ